MTIMTGFDSLLSLPLPDLAATAILGRKLARLLRRGDVVALKGGLGVGKTTLAREIVAALSPVATEVPSPTFTLVQTYPVQLADGPAGPQPCELWHFDLYRLDRADQVEELGLDEALADSVSLIEWPELVERYLPGDRVLSVELTLEAGGARSVTLSGGGAWRDRLVQLRGADPS
jgi:tRNA threonylcarbamoyladenosine biosynthesis protein TsaE